MFLRVLGRLFLVCDFAATFDFLRSSGQGDPTGRQVTTSSSTGPKRWKATIVNRRGVTSMKSMKETCRCQVDALNSCCFTYRPCVSLEVVVLVVCRQMPQCNTRGKSTLFCDEYPCLEIGDLIYLRKVARICPFHEWLLAMDIRSSGRTGKHLGESFCLGKTTCSHFIRC